MRLSQLQSPNRDLCLLLILGPAWKISYRISVFVLFWITCYLIVIFFFVQYVTRRLKSVLLIVIRVSSVSVTVFFFRFLVLLISLEVFSILWVTSFFLFSAFDFNILLCFSNPHHVWMMKCIKSLYFTYPTFSFTSDFVPFQYGLSFI